MVRRGLDVFFLMNSYSVSSSASSVDDAWPLVDVSAAAMFASLVIRAVAECCETHQYDVAIVCRGQCGALKATNFLLFFLARFQFQVNIDATQNGRKSAVVKGCRKTESSSDSRPWRESWKGAARPQATYIKTIGLWISIVYAAG